jgi:hypothetical protein
VVSIFFGLRELRISSRFKLFESLLLYQSIGGDRSDQFHYRNSTFILIKTSIYIHTKLRYKTSTRTRKVELTSSFILPIICINKMRFELSFSSAFMSNNDSHSKSLCDLALYFFFILCFGFSKTRVTIERFFL